MITQNNGEFKYCCRDALKKYPKMYADYHDMLRLNRIHKIYMDYNRKISFFIHIALVDQDDSYIKSLTCLVFVKNKSDKKKKTDDDKNGFHVVR